MKAGTAQKMVLNMLSTGVMIRAGKVFENLMVDVLPTNAKLVDRAERIIAATTGVDQIQAATLLKAAGHKVPVAIVMAKTELDAADGLGGRAWAQISRQLCCQRLTRR